MMAHSNGHLTHNVLKVWPLRNVPATEFSLLQTWLAALIRPILVIRKTAENQNRGFILLM